jgi:murein L,D-transpeptidase YafK
MLNHFINQMRLIAVIVCVALTFIVYASCKDFISEQKEYSRVRTAYTDKQATVSAKLKSADLDLDDIHILICAYKAESQLDLYVKKKSASSYKKLATYPICAGSGGLGPKRKEGDGQVPEGFYHIDRFNPSSNFYLSLGLNYPNQSDKLKSTATKLGGDIFIHGSCVTIGCLPMTNDKIKELYIYAIEARQNGQSKIPVYIFPYRFTTANVAKYNNLYRSNKSLISFWENLKTGYEKFQSAHKELAVKVDANGNYSF